MNQREIIDHTTDYVRSKLAGEWSGHDWWHVYRVWKNAVRIARNEDVDMFVVELAALLHDIADWKFHNGDDTVGPRMSREWLERCGVEEGVIAHVCQIITDASFKGAGVSTPMRTVEGMVVQDADRLDAIGAIGIGRTFAYGWAKGRSMYEPGIEPQAHQSFEQYKNNQSNTVNHFYEKLLLLKDRMQTETAKRIAERRHEVMVRFLEEFFQEWEGEDGTGQDNPISR